MEQSNPKKNKKIIKKIAMLDDELLFCKTCVKLFFSIILNKYDWRTNGIKNKFILKTIYLPQVQASLFNWAPF